MYRRLFILLAAVFLVAQSAPADIIHLKNGSILKGKVSSFADDQFMVMLDTGSGRYLSRAMVYVGDVARIEVEGAPAGAADQSGRDSSPVSRRIEVTPTTGRDSDSPRCPPTAS